MSELNRSLLLDGAAYVDQWLEFQTKNLRVPGLVVGIRHGEDMILEKAYGFANVETKTPMRTDHVFRVASHSKMFTATALMMLKEQGRLSLDDTVGKHVPKLAGSFASVTIRQVLSHAAGVPREVEESSFWELIGEFPDSKQLLEAASEANMTYPTNKRFKYSNLAYSVLGFVIESVSGKSYGQYITDNIIEPLGLTATTSEISDEVRQRSATGYSSDLYGFDRKPLVNPFTRAMAPATGVCSTARDLCAFGAAHFFGLGFLNDDSKREMQHPGWDIAQSSHKYGLGFETVKIDDRQMFGHGGGFPGFITFTLIDAEDQLVVTVLFNASGTPAETFGTSIARILNRALKASPAPDEQAARLDTYTGRFFGRGWVDDFVRFGDALVCMSPVDFDPANEVAELEVFNDNSLSIVDCGGFFSPGEKVVFERNGDGSIKRARFGSSWEYPLEEAVEVFDL